MGISEDNVIIKEINNIIVPTNLALRGIALLVSHAIR